MKNIKITPDNKTELNQAVKKANLDADSKTVADIIADCARLGIGFIDRDFPPLLPSLGPKVEGK
jgi:hypothetical protein